MAYGLDLACRAGVLSVSTHQAEARHFQLRPRCWYFSLQPGLTFQMVGSCVRPGSLQLCPHFSWEECIGGKQGEAAVMWMQFKAAHSQCSSPTVGSCLHDAAEEWEARSGGNMGAACSYLALVWCRESPPGTIYCRYCQA